MGKRRHHDPWEGWRGRWGGRIARGEMGGGIFPNCRLSASHLCIKIIPEQGPAKAVSHSPYHASRASSGFHSFSSAPGHSSTPDHLGSSRTSFVRLRQDIKPCSIYFIPSTLRKADRPRYVCTIYTDIRHGRGLIFHALIRRYELNHNLPLWHNAISVFSDWNVVSLFLSTM